MISASPYLDNMRVVAQEHEVPLFDRFALMKTWSEAGEFDLFTAVHGAELAKRVHNCLGRALSQFILAAAHPKPDAGELRKSIVDAFGVITALFADRRRLRPPQRSCCWRRPGLRRFALKRPGRAPHRPMAPARCPPSVRHRPPTQAPPPRKRSQIARRNRRASPRRRSTRSNRSQNPRATSSAGCRACRPRALPRSFSLPRVTHKLAAGEPVVIVAFGSSSTARVTARPRRSSPIPIGSRRNCTGNIPPPISPSSTAAAAAKMRPR